MGRKGQRCDVAKDKAEEGDRARGRAGDRSKDIARHRRRERLPVNEQRLHRGRRQSILKLDIG